MLGPSDTDQELCGSFSVMGGITTDPKVMASQVRMKQLISSNWENKITYGSRAKRYKILKSTDLLFLRNLCYTTRQCGEDNSKKH